MTAEWFCPEGPGVCVGLREDVFSAMANSLPTGVTKKISKQRNEQIFNNNNNELRHHLCRETGSRDGHTVSGTPAVNSHFLPLEKQTSKTLQEDCPLASRTRGMEPMGKKDPWMGRTT